MPSAQCCYSEQCSVNSAECGSAAAERAKKESEERRARTKSGERNLKHKKTPTIQINVGVLNVETFLVFHYTKWF